MILQLDRLPSMLAVVGAGVIGSGACTFRRSGHKSRDLRWRDALLPFGREISNALQAAMQDLALFLLRDSDLRGAAGVSPDNVVRQDAEDLRCWSPPDEAAIPPTELESGRPDSRETRAADGKRKLQTEIPNIARQAMGSGSAGRNRMEAARCASQSQAFTPRSPMWCLPHSYNPEVSTVGDWESSRRRARLRGWASPLRTERARSDHGDRTGFCCFQSARTWPSGVHVIGEHASELLHID